MVAQRTMIRNNLMMLIVSFIINNTLETFTIAHRVKIKYYIDIQSYGSIFKRSERQCSVLLVVVMTSRPGSRGSRHSLGRHLSSTLVRRWHFQNTDIIILSGAKNLILPSSLFPLGESLYYSSLCSQTI